MSTPVTELLYVQRDPAWAPWAVQYFFLIGLSYASVALSLPGVALAIPRWRGASRIALIGALITGLAAPVALLSDLGNPGRFLNFYLHPQLTSWMSWGAWFIPAYVALLALYAWAALAPQMREAAQAGGPLAPLRRALGAPERPALVKALGLAAVVAAIPVAVYTGVEVMAVRARPLWATSLLPWQFGATAFAGACGMALILDRLLGDGDRATERLLSRTLVAALSAVVAIGAAWFALALLAPGSTEARALSQVANSPVWRVNALWLAAATIAPAILAAARPVGAAWITGLLALNAAWMFRWTIFMGGQEIPKTGAGWYSHPLELGPEGLLGIVGTAGLVLFLTIVVATLITPSPSPASAARPAAGIGG